MCGNLKFDYKKNKNSVDIAPRQTSGLPHPKKAMDTSHANNGIPHIHYLPFLMKIILRVVIRV